MSTGALVTPPSPSHRLTWDLIPWLVNGSASGADRELAEAHLRHCADCRDEFAFQSQVHAGLRVESQADDRQARSALQRLYARIDLEDEGRDVVGPVQAMSPRRGNAPPRGAIVRVLTAAVIVQAVGLLVLGAAFWLRGVPVQADTSYATLTRPEPPAPAATIRFVPSPALDLVTLRRMLTDAGLRIVGSNPESTIYTLAPIVDPAAAPSTPAQRAEQTHLAIAHLRGRPGVLLAEPIAGADRVREP